MTAYHVWRAVYVVQALCGSWGLGTQMIVAPPRQLVLSFEVDTTSGCMQLLPCVHDHMFIFTGKICPKLDTYTLLCEIFCTPSRRQIPSCILIKLVHTAGGSSNMPAWADTRSQSAHNRTVTLTDNTNLQAALVVQSATHKYCTRNNIPAVASSSGFCSAALVPAACGTCTVHKEVAAHAERLTVRSVCGNTGQHCLMLH
jgi:hypothetical protein